MVATLSVRVRTGAPAGSLSAAVTGIDFCSIDTNLNTLANRTANPITIPSSGTISSFEKWCQLNVDIAPANSVANFLYWSAQGLIGGVGTGVSVFGQGAVATGSYATPVSTTRSTAGLIPTVSGSVWDLGTYSSVNQLTAFLILQLNCGTTAVQGNISQGTICLARKLWSAMKLVVGKLLLIDSNAAMPTRANLAIA